MWSVRSNVRRSLPTYTSMQRTRAIYYCLKYGILPWWCYERTCHYEGMTYGEHLRLNLRYAARWLLRQETEDDRDFERDTNNNAPDS